MEHVPTKEQRGLWRHLGHNDSFAISLPSRDVGLRFVQCSKDNLHGLELTDDKGKRHAIQVKAQRGLPTLNGKAFSRPHQTVKDNVHCLKGCDHPEVRAD